MEFQLLLLFLEIRFDPAPLDAHFLKIPAQFPNFIGSVQEAGGLLPGFPLELFDTPAEGLDRSSPKSPCPRSPTRLPRPGPATGPGPPPCARPPAELKFPGTRSAGPRSSPRSPCGKRKYRPHSRPDWRGESCLCPSGETAPERFDIPVSRASIQDHSRVGVKNQLPAQIVNQYFSGLADTVPFEYTEHVIPQQIYGTGQEPEQIPVITLQGGGEGDHRRPGTPGNIRLGNHRSFFIPGLLKIFPKRKILSPKIAPAG